MSNKLNINSKISSLKGVGPKIENILKNAGIIDLSDLLFYFPRKYNDYRYLKNIDELVEGEEITIKGKIISSGLLL